MTEVARHGGLRALPVRVGLVRISTPVLLGLIVTAVTSVHGALALKSPSPWVVPDELIYSELAKSMAAGELPAIRGETSLAYGFGYPTLLAPVWALFSDLQTAYAVAKVLNAFLLSLTAIPAFFLARRFVGQRHSLVVAAFSVAVPSMLFAGTLMTEVALYPAFVLALLGITAAIERPRARTQAGALAAILLACTIKVLAIVLVPAFVAGAVMYHWLDTRSGAAFRARLRLYVPSYVALGAATALLFAVPMVSGARANATLGAYDVVRANVDLAGTVWWVLLHVAELGLYLAVIPFVLTVLVITGGLRAHASRSARLFAAVCVSVSAALLVAVAAFASTSSPGGAAYPENVSRLYERSTFVLAPLFLTGVAIWLADRRTPLAVMTAATAGVALLPATVPLGDLDAARIQALALVPWMAFADDVAWPLGVLILTSLLGFGLIISVRARASALAFFAPVAFVFFVVGIAGQVSREGTSAWTHSVTFGTVPNWVDQAVGEEESVSVLWAERSGEPFVAPHPRQYVVFVGEFFNRSMGRVFELGSPMPYGLPTTKVHLASGVVVGEDGRPVLLGELVLAPCHVDVTGSLVARDMTTGARVFRVRHPVHASVANRRSCPWARGS